MITDDEGNTALHFAPQKIWCTAQDIIEIIKVSGPQANQLINLKNKEGRTALAIAVLFDRLVIAQTLLKNGADPTIPDNTKRIPFQWAMYDQLTSESIQAMIQSILTMIQNINVNHKYSDGSTLLHCAVKCRRNGLVKGVLDRGADCTIEDNDGNTALDLAKQMKPSSDVKKIIKLLQQ
uniref:Uncharacterized protein n=1 Tax=Spongospora subterranea TaxID=70186 RepID=A0A0H5QYW4_9EUKA|eukprot:CRZ06861.1 hypothetical protein [Spongospora subterranea]